MDSKSLPKNNLNTKKATLGYRIAFSIGLDYLLFLVEIFQLVDTGFVK